MSGIAHGGKVWNFDKKAAGVQSGSLVKTLVIGILIWGIAALAGYLVGQHTIHYEVTELDTFAQEYGASVKEKHNDWSLNMTVGLFVSAFVANGLLVYKSNVLAYRWLFFGFIVGIIGLFVASTMGMMNPVEQKPNPFVEWAEKNHGYSSIEKVESSPQTVYEAVNAKGESVRFKVYYDGEFQYIYENVDQLQVVLDQVAEKKIAAEKKLSE